MWRHNLRQTYLFLIVMVSFSFIAGAIHTEALVQSPHELQSTDDVLINLVSQSNRYS